MSKGVKVQMLKRGTVLFVLFLCLTMIYGCAFGSDNDSLEEDEEAVLKVAVSNERAFYQLYGNVFMQRYPNVDFEIVTLDNMSGSGGDFDQQWKELIEAEQPDIIVFPNMELFEWHANEGFLYELDSFFLAGDWDEEQMDENVIAYLRTLGNGVLYGLSPTFTSKVLYYNVDLFEEYNVPRPHNGMSWDEFLQLAAHFPVGDDPSSGVYGYYHPVDTAFDLFSLVGRSKQLNWVDDGLTAATLNTPGWEQVWDMLLDGYGQQFMYRAASAEPDPEASSYAQNLFTMGRAAMTINEAFFINEMNFAAQMESIDLPNWDIVTMPSDPNYQMETTELRVNAIVGIYAGAPNMKAAQTFMNYIHSDDAAQLIARPDMDRLMVRPDYSMEREGRNMEPFYLMTPVVNQSVRLTDTLYNKVSTIMEEEIVTVLRGEKTAQQALGDMEKQVQAELMLVD